MVNPPPSPIPRHMNPALGSTLWGQSSWIREYADPSHPPPPPTQWLGSSCLEGNAIVRVCYSIEFTVFILYFSSSSRSSIRLDSSRDIEERYVSYLWTSAQYNLSAKDQVYPCFNHATFNWVPIFFESQFLVTVPLFWTMLRLHISSNSASFTESCQCLHCFIILIYVGEFMYGITAWIVGMLRISYMLRRFMFRANYLHLIPVVAGFVNC